MHHGGGVSAEIVIPFARLGRRSLHSLPEGREIARGSDGPKPLDNGATDEELMAALATGTRTALDILFKRHGTAVRNVAHRILKDQSEAVDLRQEVFLYLFEKAHLYNSALSSPVSWIIQITYHRAINRRRYLTSRQHYTLHPIDEERAPTSRSVPDLTSLDARTLLQRLKGQLTPTQRVTLELHFFEGYTFREIAEITEQSLGNVRNHYYRGVVRLRELIFAEKQPPEE